MARWRLRLPRPLIADPGLASLKSAARAAIVMPAVFALASKVIGNPQTALFAAFGSFAMLVLASFSGPALSRLTAYLTLGTAGLVLVTLGTLCSGNAWLAAVVMAVVGFAILLSGMINGYFAAGTTAAILAFVLSVAVPAPASAIPDRLAGWALAAGAGTIAVMLLWPPRASSTLSADAARACQRLADLADALCHDPAAVPARVEAATKTVDALRVRLTGTPRRPTGPTGPAVALGVLIDEVGWLCVSLAALARASAGDLCAAENTITLQKVAAVLRVSAAQLTGEQPPGDAGLAAADDLPGQLENAQATAAQILAERISAAPELADEAALDAMVGRSFKIYSIAYTTRQIAGYAAAASAPPIWHPRRVRAAVSQATLAGSLSWLRSGVSAATDFGMARSGVRSVWFRNSIRGAVGLAVAVFIAQETGLQHSFWVVLGTLSVLRSNALGTGRSVLSALIGTAIGILVGAAILIPVHGNTTVLWALLPVAVLIAGYAPRVISFAAGQAAFTVVVLILFNIIEPAGWKVGIVRIEDVAYRLRHQPRRGPGVLAARGGGPGPGEPGRGLLAHRGLRGRHGRAGDRAGQRARPAAGPSRPPRRRWSDWTTRSASSWPSARLARLTRTGPRGWSPGPRGCCAPVTPWLGCWIWPPGRSPPCLPAQLGLATQPGAAAQPGLVAQPGPAAGQCRAAPCGRGAQPARTAGPRWLSSPAASSRARANWTRKRSCSARGTSPWATRSRTGPRSRRRSLGTRPRAAACWRAHAMRSPAASRCRPGMHS